MYITRGHFDHFYGLSVLLARFPSARAIATPKTVNAMQMSFTPPVERLARRLFPGQVAAELVAPQPYAHDTFDSRGQELRILDQGHTDSPDTTSLYVPSIDLVVAGDVVYNQCHMYVGDTTPESGRTGWRRWTGWQRSSQRLLLPVTEVWRARLHRRRSRTPRLFAGLRSATENRDVRPGAVRSDDEALPGSGWPPISRG